MTGANRRSRRTTALVAIAAGLLVPIGGTAAASQTRYEGPKEMGDALEELREKSRDSEFDVELIEWLASYRVEPESILPEEYLDPKFQGPERKPSHDELKRLADLFDSTLAAANSLAEAWMPYEEAYARVGEAERTELLVQFVIDNEELIRAVKEASDTQRVEFRQILEGK